MNGAVKLNTEELETLAQAVREVAAERPDHVDSGGVYFVEDWDEELEEHVVQRDEAGNPKPGCIIGHAAWKLKGRTLGGVDIVEWFIGNNDDCSVEGAIEPEDMSDRRARELNVFLQEVQSKQDSQMPWGDAVKEADEEVRRLMTVTGND